MTVIDPVVVAGAPHEVRERMTRRLITVGDVWFPTLAELERWRESAAPLYLRWVGEDDFEIGPRMPTMAAARLCPVLRGQLQRVGSNTEIGWRLRLPRLTAIGFVGWSVALAVWAVWISAQASAGEQPIAWLVFWFLLAAMTGAGGWFGWQTGARMLASAMPWLREALRQPLVRDEDWA